jgi:excisionase family DNA binding protein
MVQGYYTLEEAARILGMGSDDLSQMAQRREVRAFADRGTWRFRTQDIEELARRRGVASNPDVPLGEAPPPRPHDSPARRGEPTGDAGVFNFSLGDSSDQVEIGQEIISETPSGAQKVAGKGGSSSRRLGGPKSPPPKPGSDSDVRLVADGSDLGFQIAGEKTEPDVAGPKSGPKSGARKKPQGPKQDSGVRLVPMEAESDSDVKIVPDSRDDVSVIGNQPPKSGTDSYIRLESPGQARRGAEDSFLTEEIDLDAELRAAEEAAAQASKKVQTPKTPAPPSPFELSEVDLNVPKAEQTPPPPVQTTKEDSSDFDLSLEGKEDLSPLELSSGEMASLSAKEEEVSLGDMPSARVTGASDSGINLQEPADSGISLEQGSDSSEEIEFELSLDAESTPKPAKAAPNVDSSSEFELTLEDSARLAPLEEEAAPAAAGEEKDIFETDFEVPALEDESGSQAVALDESDTDLESSDFDLALGDEDMATEEESGSQVVALEDEEEVDEGAATVARPRRGGAGVAEGEEVEELLGEDEGQLEAEEEPEVAGRRAPVVVGAPPSWGIFTPVVLILSTLFMFMVGLMSLELLHGMWGYRQPYKVSSMVIRTIGGLMPWVDSKDLNKD